jgi:predicted PurR-regulated permease PerM
MADPEKTRLRIEDGGFLAIVLIVTAAFVWLTLPFFGAILWGLVAAILFWPVHRHTERVMGGRRNLAASLSLILILAVVIVPSLAIASSLVAEAASIYERIRSGQIDLGRMADNFRTQLPPWADDALERANLSDLQSVQDMLGTSISAGLQQIASQALWVGQGALSFLASLGIMLYLTFFLLRDGRQLGLAIARAVPLRADLRDELVRNFIVVVRATMKGSVVIAIIQGILGGVIFWFLGIEGAILWGLLMGFFSLVPAIGTGIVWVPVAAYLFVTGSVWEGAILVACGVFIIGLVDNLLRPILVGHDTRMPDFVVLISTLAGINLFGLSGFIIGPVIAALFIAVWKLVGELRERGTPAE